MREGFSLIESLVIISIISILSAISLSALPAARAHQQIISDTELIKALLVDSKQRALNQVRPEECIAELGVAQNDKESGAFCSDVGIAFRNNEVIQFADSSGNGGYSADDYVISRHQTLVYSEEGSSNELLMVGVPPSVVMYNQGGVMEPDDVATIKLSAIGGETRTLQIHPLGTVDVIIE